MQNKKILSLVLATTMSISMLTGCGAKPEEEFQTLYGELTQITEASTTANMKLELKDEIVKKMTEETESEETEESFMELEPSEALKDLIDENGNMTIDIGANVKHNANKQSDVEVSLLGESMRAIVDNEDVYLEIDGLFDILGSMVGEEIELIKLFFGEAEYLKTTTSTMESEESAEMPKDFEMPDINKFITKETVTKAKDGTFTLSLDNSYVSQLVTDEMKESFGLQGINNSNATLMVNKNKDSGMFVIKYALNVENLILCNLDLTITPGTVTIELPNEEVVLDTTSDEGLSLDFGFGESTEPEDENLDWEWNYENEVEAETEDTSETTTESYDNVELDYDFVSTSEYDLDFVVASRDGVKIKEHYETLKTKIEEAISGDEMAYVKSEYTDESSNMYNVEYTADFTEYEECISVYLTDDYTSLKSTYYMSADYNLETLASISERIEKMTGVIVPVSELNSWISDMKENYNPDYWIMNSYAYYEDMYFDIYLWDGEDIDIAITRLSADY